MAAQYLMCCGVQGPPVRPETLCNEHLLVEMDGQMGIRSDLLGHTSASMTQFLPFLFFLFYFLHFFPLESCFVVGGGGGVECRFEGTGDEWDQDT